MKRAWTGSRFPAGGFSTREIERIHEDVRLTVRVGDEVATGGCLGVDGIVLHAAAIAGCRVVAMLPSDRRQVDEDAIRLFADVVIDGREGYLERYRRLVDWADQVRAISLFEIRGPDGRVAPGRGGTRYTAKYAEKAGKLDHVTVLRAG